MCGHSFFDASLVPTLSPLPSHRRTLDAHNQSHHHPSEDSFFASPLPCDSLSLRVKINKANMQPTYNSPQYSRTSYGFPTQDNNGIKPQKTFPMPSNAPYRPPEHLANSIRTLQQKNELSDSPSVRKKVVPGDGSPVYSGPFSGPNGKEAKLGAPIRHQNSDPFPEENPQDRFLRGTCSNILKKFESSTNLGSSLRNTTHFRVGKFPQELKKSSEIVESFKKSGIKPNGPQESPSCNLLHPGERLPNQSRTPTKLGVGSQLDKSAKLTSKTPVKCNVFDQTKNSNISKGSTEVSDKKTFKSLNEIVESKAKEKMLQERSCSTKKRSAVINGFEIGGVLGKGKFGEVFLGRHREAGFVVALKKVVKSKVVEFKMVEQFCSEIRLHCCLEHPNIVRFYGCFEDNNDIYLVMEYLNGGTLFDYLNEVNSLSLRQTVDYLRDIIEALAYMHDKSIAHRDIKPENIVISSEGVAKLCDFGWSALVETSRKTYCGTFDYAPPEILERKNYDASVDIWCIGVLTYQLLTGRVPFEGEQRTEVMEKILNVENQRIDFGKMVPEAREFIEALLHKDPVMRPKSQDLLKFKLFSLFPSKTSKSGSSGKKP